MDQENPSFTPISPAKLRSLAFALLAKREYSAQSLKSKLIAFGGNEADVDILVQELISGNYQSDERMAGMLVRSNMRKGRGPSRIQQDLKKHHIDRELAEDNIQQVNWLQQAIELRARKFGAEIPQDQKEKARQLRFLQYRGFDLDTCFKAIAYQSDMDE
jgi:regulatory protein